MERSSNKEPRKTIELSFVRSSAFGSRTLGLRWKHLTTIGTMMAPNTGFFKAFAVFQRIVAFLDAAGSFRTI